MAPSTQRLGCAILANSNCCGCDSRQAAERGLLEGEEEKKGEGGGGPCSSSSDRSHSSTTTISSSGDSSSSQSSSAAEHRPDSFRHFANSTRYLVLFLTTACLALLLSNSVALNFTVICMNKAMDSGERNNNVSSGTAEGELAASSAERGALLQPMFTNAERAMLFSAVPVGTLLGTLPITPLASRIGIRKTFSIYGLVSAAATLFTPLSAWLHFGLLLLMRFLQGVAVAICFPASGAVTAEWFPLQSAGTVVALFSCHIQIGPILTMPLAGELCESRWGWPAVYYLQAVLTTLAFTAFFAFFRDSPSKHRNVSAKELGKIQRGKTLSETTTARSKRVPYRAMLCDPTFWGIVLCSIGSTFGFYVFMQYGPIYLNKTLKFDVERTGFAVALPCLLSLLAKFIVGPLSDYATFVSDRFRVILFATISQVPMALCFCALALLPADSPRWLFQACFTAVTVFCGMNCAGLGKSAQLISRQFAHTMSAFCVFACSWVIIFIPVLVSVIAPDNEPSQWSRIFLFVAAVVVGCVLVFNFTAEASPRPWTFAVKKRRSLQQKERQMQQQKRDMEEGGRAILVVRETADDEAEDGAEEMREEEEEKEEEGRQRQMTKTTVNARTMPSPPIIIVQKKGPSSPVFNGQNLRRISNF